MMLLRREARRLGVTLVTSKPEHEIQYPASSQPLIRAGIYGCDFDTCKVYIRDGATLGALIHEMGHVVASTEEPMGCDELSFVGWEYLVAKRAKCVRKWMQWIKGNYHIDYFTPFSSLTPVEQRDWIDDRILDSMAIGNIVDGVPVAIRGEKRHMKLATEIK